MPVSDKEPQAPPGVLLAVTAEALYLVNLLLLPGVGFVLLLLLYLNRRRDAPPLALSHLQQTVSASIWGGVLLVLINGLILLLGGYSGAHTWVIVIIYFTLCHSTLVVFGAYGLAKAMAGQCWRYPVIGRKLHAGCFRKKLS